MNPSTQKALKTLLRLKKEHVDAIAAERSKCLTEIEMLRREKDLALEKLESERNFTGGIESLQTFSGFHKKIDDKVEAIDFEIKVLFEKIEELNKAFEQTYKEFKANENVLEKADLERKHLEEKLENETMDEVGLRKFHM